MSILGSNSSNTSITPTAVSNTNTYLAGNQCNAHFSNAAQMNVSYTTIGNNLTAFIKLQVSDDGVNWYDYSALDSSTNATITATGELRAVAKATVSAITSNGTYALVFSPLSGRYVRAAASVAAAMTNGTLGVNIRTFNR